MTLTLDPCAWLSNTEPREVALYLVTGLPVGTSAAVNHLSDGSWQISLIVGKTTIKTAGHRSPEAAIADLSMREGLVVPKAPH